MKFHLKTLFKIAVFLCFIFISSTSLKAQSCLPNGITFLNQESIDDFSINYPGCTIIEGSVTISDLNDNITNLNGLLQITEIGGYLEIQDSNEITDLTGLDNLQGIESLFIGGNNGLISLHGLESLSTLGDILQINDNNNLVTISALTNLTSLNKINIQYNAVLPSLNGLENVSSVSEIFISSNNSLENLNGLEGVENLASSIDILFNPLIQNLYGLHNLESVGSHLSITQNQSLTSLIGLEGLSTISGANEPFMGLRITSNPQLININSLSNLTSINETLLIADNDQLVNIEGVRNIDATTIADLRIYNNNILSNCAVTSVCDYLDIEPNIVEIHDNMAGCNTEGEVQTICDNLGVEEITNENSLKIYPNPTSNTFKISGLKDGIVEIIDSQGRTVKQMASNENNYSISELSSGIYFVKITSEKTSITKQLIKT
ncbi:MAG: T9SS type A sorting domain-containing protein [Aequorivita sp.]|nr:T9SS type A sorting domain-containing protein [Aequorivita sp.]